MSRETLGGLTGNYFEGVFFSESLAPPGIDVKATLSVRRNRQNSNLNEIKKLLAQQAQGHGANAVVGFRYGQKAHKWWQLGGLWWDSESWFGEGQAVHIP